MDDEHKTQATVPEGHQPTPLSVASDDNSTVQMENYTSTSGGNTGNSQNHSDDSGEGESADQVNKASESLNSLATATASNNNGRFLL